MLQTVGQALTPIEPGGVGRVSTRGEIWTATSADGVNTELMTSICEG